MLTIKRSTRKKRNTIAKQQWRLNSVWNVKCNNDYSVQNDESQCGHCTNDRRVRKRNKNWCDLRRLQKMERGTAVTCDRRLFHRRAAATGNALSPTVDRRVRRTSRDVDEAERSRSIILYYRLQAVYNHETLYTSDRKESIYISLACLGRGCAVLLPSF